MIRVVLSVVENFCVKGLTPAWLGGYVTWWQKERGAQKVFCQYEWAILRLTQILLKRLNNCT